MTQSAPEGMRPGLLTQAAPLTTLNAEDRTCEVTFTTGDLVLHYVQHRGEVRRMPTRVVVDDQSIDLEFLRTSGPVLDSHAAWSSQSVVGSVEEAWIADGVGRARIKFATTDDVEPIWQKVAQGHLRNVSAGFEVLEQELRMEPDEDGGEFEVMYFTQIRVLELSMVAVPADKGSRVQSAGKPLTQEEMRGLTSAHQADRADAARDAVQSDAAAAADTVEEKDIDMAGKQQGAANQAQTTKADTSQADMAPDADAIRAAERQRINQIGEIGRTLNLPADVVNQAQFGDTSVDDFRATAIDLVAQRDRDASAGIGGATAHVTGDAHDRFVQGAIEGQAARLKMPGGKPNEFSSMTMGELARQSLTVANVAIPHSHSEMVGRAFVQAGAHSTSDFANVLSSLMGKSVLRGWQEAEETFQKWTRAGSSSDFKQSPRVGLGLIDALPEVPEGGNYSYGTVGDRGEVIPMMTYGRLLKITRQAIINDDQKLFTTLPAAMGRAAKRTIGNLCYAVLTGNPTMSDGTALFHAGHANLAASGSALSVTSLSAARAAMRTQKEKAGGSALNIRPRSLIVPAALETLAQQLMTSVAEPVTGKGHATNPVAGMAEVIADARLDDTSATAWFLAADPNAFDTVEVVYLDGVQEPFLDEQMGWSMDGAEIKVRIDAGVGPLDHRTFYKNAGA